VLEVGTGSGYQTAILAELVPEIYTVERIEPLMRRSRQQLRSLGYRNVHFRLSDGSWGWEAHAPFEAILVTAAPKEIPEALRQQLGTQGRMVIPVGDGALQELVLVSKQEGEATEERIERVTFVPLVAGNLCAG
jgi:protein-L-isoaspartate(D-aspartate) O-methyltransferase